MSTTMTVAEKREQKREAIHRLRQLVKPGDRIYTRDVGGPRATHTTVLLPVCDNGTPAIMDITYLVAQATGTRRSTAGGLRAGGFDLVYNLGVAMFGRGQEAAAYGYGSYRNGQQPPEDDGGYMLRHCRL